MIKSAWKYDDWDEYGKSYYCANCKCGITASSDNMVPHNCPKCGSLNSIILHCGEYVLIHNEDSYSLGKVQRLNPTTVSVYYKYGDDVTDVPYEQIHKILNEGLINSTDMGPGR